MTHRSGLEETIKDLFVVPDEDLRPIGQYLPSRLPGRFLLRNYSRLFQLRDYLAAYIVQRVSGEKVRRLRRQARASAAEHGARHFPPAAARESQAPHVQRLSPRFRRRRSLLSVSRLRPPVPCSASAEAMSHFMIAAFAERQIRRRADSEARNRASRCTRARTVGPPPCMPRPSAFTRSLAMAIASSATAATRNSFTAICT